MMEAAHRKWAGSLAKFYLHHRFKKNFSAFYMARFPDLSTWEGRPVLLLPNHSTWWDGFFIFWLNQTYFRRTPFLMMLEQQLRKFPFFRFLGAYSVNRGNAVSARKSLQYTQDLLNHDDTGKNLVILFPQGKLIPHAEQPIQFERGISLLLRNLKRPLVIQLLAIYTWLGAEELPEVAFYFDQSIMYPENEPEFKDLESRMNHIRTTLIKEISSGKNFDPVFSGKKSIHKRFGMT